MQRSKSNKGFSLIELIIVIAIMAVLVGILAPQFISYMHKSKVAADWANLKAYYSEIEIDYIDTGEHNPAVPTMHEIPNSYNLTEIHFLDGRTVKLKAGSYIICRSTTTQGGYQIIYYCDKNYSDPEKHNKTCQLVLGL